jgi:hypothetical protein
MELHHPIPTLSHVQLSFRKRNQLLHQHMMGREFNYRVMVVDNMMRKFSRADLKLRSILTSEEMLPLRIPTKSIVVESI